MIEGGNVYICEKKEKNGKYFLTLLENKEIKASGEVEVSGDANAILNGFDNSDKKANLKSRGERNRK